LFVKVHSLLSEGRFIEDFDMIAIEAPDLSEDFIKSSFIHIGDNEKQKNIRTALWKVIEMESVLYHSFARGPEKTSIYVLSKQVASQKRDEKTRKHTDAGEKPLSEEYLVLAKISVQSTTLDSHGHVLGECKAILSSYCALCKAGSGDCMHKAAMCWMQHLHWGEGRPISKPATADYCTWIPGMRSKRTCSTLVPAWQTHIERLPSSNMEAKLKTERGIKKNTHKGISARFDIYSGDTKKQNLLRDPQF
jgi:hypothetical protein